MAHKKLHTDTEKICYCLQVKFKWGDIDIISFHTPTEEKEEFNNRLGEVYER